MMRRSYVPLMLCCTLMLASCGPRLTQTPVDTDSATLKLDSPASGDYLSAKFFAGGYDVYDLRLMLSGNNLRVNAPTYCSADRERIQCLVPKLPAGKNFVLPVSGSNVSAVALYKRSSSGPDLARRIASK